MRALTYFEKSGPPKDYLEEIFFVLINMRIKLEEHYKLGVQMFLAFGEREKAIDFYFKVLDRYYDKSRTGSDIRSKSKIKEKLKAMEQIFTQPMQISVDRKSNSKDITNTLESMANKLGRPLNKEYINVGS